MQCGMGHRVLNSNCPKPYLWRCSLDNLIGKLEIISSIIEAVLIKILENKILQN
jgi:hypothetical protein